MVQAAADEKGRSLSAEVESRLEQSFNMEAMAVTWLKALLRFEKKPGQEGSLKKHLNRMRARLESRKK